ncbi:glutathione S-transferase family protein [Tabrizicola sp.]|uniref:glutathione S-transferase family protein n=1 Tax=Tabrizicola sp. TaxID=2005166 RepID=UPI0035B4171F
MTLTLHHAPDFASTIIRFALEELELPHTLALADIDGGALATPEYRQVNPVGLIPALETDSGPIFETGAILLWLVDQTGRLGPGPKDPDRGAFLSWLFFTSNALHQAALAMFYPHRPAGEANSAAAQAVAQEQITARLGLIETMIATQAPRWLSPDHPGVLGYYIGVLVRWLILLSPAPHGVALDDFPYLKAVLAAHEARPAAQRVAASDRLGPHPFTKPGS